MRAEPTNTPPLLDLALVVIEDAKTTRLSGVRFQHWLLTVGVIAVLVQSAPAGIYGSGHPEWVADLASGAAYVCAISGIVLQGMHWRCVREANGTHALGSTIKRRALLIDSLGETTEPLDIRLLREQAGADAARRALEKGQASTYYSSRSEQGFERLRENLQESAFFTRSLYARAANVAWLKFATVTLGIVIGFCIVVYFSPREIGVVAANCVLAFISFLVSADQLGRAMDWQNGATTVERIERRLQAIKPDGGEGCIAAYADYEVAVATTPAVPTAIYDAQRGHLDQVWREGQNQR